MKRLSLILICIGLICITGCQATPEEKVVQDKEQGYLQPTSEVIQDTESDQSQENSVYSYEKEVVSKINTSDKNVEIIVDAEVLGPKGCAFDVKERLPRKFTRDELQKALDFFYPDADMYEKDGEPPLTKSQIEEKIISVKMSLSDLDSQTESMTESQREELRKIYEESIKELERQYPSAPETVEKWPVSLDEVIEKGSVMLSFLDQKTGDSLGSGVITTNDMEKMRTNMMILSRAGISELLGRSGVWNEEAAVEAGNNIITQLGWQDEFALFHVSYIEEQPGLNRFEMIYTRTDQEMIENYALESNQNPDPGATYSYYWLPECIVINLDSLDNCQIRYYSPSELGETLNSGVELIPFDEVLKQMSTGLSNKSVLPEGYEAQRIVINKIRFGTMCISRKDRTDEYITVPVWDFYGNVSTIEDFQKEYGELEETELLKKEDSISSLLTINALDGSIIDRSVGY